MSGAGPVLQPLDAPEDAGTRTSMARVLLVRHADAGERAGWIGADRDRPLSGEGRGQANRLAALFDGQPLEHLLTSGYVRCVETVEPLAVRRHLVAEPVAWLEEKADAARALAALLAAGSVVACTHGDVVSGILFELADRGVSLGSSPRMQKGSTWILEVGDGRVVSARYLAPPA